MNVNEWFSGSDGPELALGILDDQGRPLFIKKMKRKIEKMRENGKGGRDAKLKTTQKREGEREWNFQHTEKKRKPSRERGRERDNEIFNGEFEAPPNSSLYFSFFLFFFFIFEIRVSFVFFSFHFFFSSFLIIYNWTVLIILDSRNVLGLSKPYLYSLFVHIYEPEIEYWQVV